METPLDQEITNVRRHFLKPKLISLILIIVNVVLITNILFAAINTVQSLDNTLLPQYAALYVIGDSINWACFMILGIILGVFFRILKKYTISAVCLAVFLIAGFILKDHLTLFKYFVPF